MKKVLLGSVCGLALGMAGSGVAHAQGQEGADNFSSGDIVVTATRREERLQDVPLAVTAITEEALRTKGINSLMDLGSGKVPGLTAPALFGSETTLTFAVRGQTAADASQGTADLPVAVYIDGVPYPRAQGVALDLVTPERIEVLRGPQGQLFGRNAEAGAVQIISRRPSGEWGGDFTGTIGNYSTNALKGRLDLPSIGGFKVQLAGTYRKHGGYVKAPSNPNLQNIRFAPMNALSSFQFPVTNYDRDLSQLKTYGGRVAVEYDSGPFNAYYSYDQSYARDDQGLTLYDTSSRTGTIFNPTSTYDSPFTLFTLAGPGGTPAAFLQYPLGSPQVGKKYPSSIDFSVPWVPFETRGHGHMLNLTYNASDALTLRSISGYRYVERQGGNALTQAVAPVFSVATEYLRSRSYSQEFQAIYDTSTFDLTVGAIYFREEIKDERSSFFAANCLVLPLGPGFTFTSPCTTNGQASRGAYPLLGNDSFKRSYSKTRALGLYAQASWKPDILDSKLELIGGLRYSNDKKRAHRPIDFGLCPTGAQVKCVGGKPGMVDIGNTFKTSRVDPAFTIKYNFTPDINAYARFAIGYRDGGSNVRSAVFNSFGTDELTSYEIGLKSQLFDRRVLLNVAAFHNVLKDEQLNLQSALPLNPSVTDTFNSPKKKTVNGVELEISAKLLPGLTLSGNYTYLDATRAFVGIENTVAGQPTVSFLATGTANDITGFVVDAATAAAHPNSIIIWQRSQNTPKHAASIAGDYIVPLGDVNLALHGDWVYTSSMVPGAPGIYVTNVTNGMAVPKPVYNGGVSTNRFNARMSFQDIPLAGGATGEVTLWVKNITNTADGAFAFAAGNGLNVLQPQPSSAVYLQPPRTYSTLR